MRQLCLIVAIFTFTACGEVPQTPVDAATDGPDVDAVIDPCTQPQISIDDFFVCVNREICTVYEDCFGSDTAHLDCDDLPLRVFGNLPPQPLKVVIHDAVDSGRAQWNPTQARACIDLLNNTTNGRCSLFKNGGDVFATCAAVIGNVTNGQACQNDIECATPGARCRGMGTNMCTGYVCQAPVAAGQMCINNAFCRPQDHCVQKRIGNPQVDMSVCATGEAGQVCDRDGDCDRGLFCNGGLNNSTAAGNCTVAKTAGSICKVDEECERELLCIGNFGTANGTCRDVRTVSAMCDGGSGYSGCWGHQVCDAAANVLGTCRTAPDLGQACATVGGTASFCGGFMTCVGSLCVAPGDIGQMCMATGAQPDGCNEGLFCTNALTMTPAGTCAARLANGLQCRPNTTTTNTGSSKMCRSDWCSNGVCTDFPTCF